MDVGIVHTRHNHLIPKIHDLGFRPGEPFHLVKGACKHYLLSLYRYESVYQFSACSFINPAAL